MKKINKYEDFIIEHYKNCDEENRFNLKAKRTEYLTTMHYIKKFAKKGCKILEVGAGTGAYSVELAKMGYKVTALELVEHNLSILKEKAKGIENITCVQGDAMDLSCFEENSFDVVLNLGPMYHLFNEKDKNKAISESLRVCKKGGIAMFAYLTHSSIVWGFGVRKNRLDELKGFLTKEGKLRDVPKEIFSSYFIEDFNKQFEKSNSTFITNVATDGLAYLMQDYIDNIMSEENYNELFKWHLSTCERLDHQGVSSHMLYICKKNKD